MRDEGGREPPNTGEDCRARHDGAAAFLRRTEPSALMYRRHFWSCVPTPLQKRHKTQPQPSRTQWCIFMEGHRRIETVADQCVASGCWRKKQCAKSSMTDSESPHFPNYTNSKAIFNHPSCPSRKTLLPRGAAVAFATVRPTPPPTPPPPPSHTSIPTHASAPSSTTPPASLSAPAATAARACLSSVVFRHRFGRFFGLVCLLRGGEGSYEKLNLIR